MRIQHNIMAMNAYRNYNLNNKALSGNLEKLSSGYKINRAGDDAAGLAISEKMRAQITGLNAAQKNVKDGISLVKTAEGAMQEIQDMLNRMDYLATQSANGTYQDEVDREALQKEVNQLKDEIDRIADSANFNGIKLLDGSKDGTGASLKAAQTAAANAATNVAKMKTELNAANNMQVAGKLTAKTDADVIALFKPKSTSTNPIDDVGDKTILETDAKETGPVGFTVDLDGVDYVMSADTDANEKVTVTIHGETLEITQADIKASIKRADGTALQAGDKVTGTQLAEVFAKKVADGAGGVWTDTKSTPNNTYKVTANGTKLVFAAQDNQSTDANRHYDVEIGATNATTTEVAAVKHKFTADTYTAGTADTTDTLTFTATVTMADGTDKTFTTAAMKSDATTNDVVAALKDAKVTIDGKDVKLGDLFDITQTTNKISLEAKDGGAAQAKVKTLALTDTNGAAGNVAQLGATAPVIVAGKDAYTAGLGNSYVNPGTENIIMAGEEGKDLLASTVLTFSADHLKDGSLIKLGNESYRIALGENSAYKGEANADGVFMYEGAKVVHLADIADPKAPTTAELEKISSKLAEVAKDNNVFTVSHKAGTGGAIGLKQLADAKDDTDMSTMENFASYVKVSTITTAGDESIKNDAIAKAQANYDEAVKKQEAADAKVIELSKNPGKALQLQIGDTSEDWNQLQVNIGSMKTAALGIADLDIGTAEKAASAINTIKDAINNVSSVRGDLGAYQNRLDHTANNLSVMAENIQDAESTIRDTDVAEEMMSYVKNNILVQSAQAMLAQANQVPQGVLQLLG